MRGISISSVSTSGRKERILSRATYGSGAVPATSMSASPARASLKILRTIAESSTIRTRIFRFGPIGLGSSGCDVLFAQQAFPGGTFDKPQPPGTDLEFHAAEVSAPRSGG